MLARKKVGWRVTTVALAIAGVLASGLNSAASARADDPVVTDVSSWALAIPGSVLSAAAAGQTELPPGQFAALLANKTKYSALWADVAAGTTLTSAEEATLAAMEAQFAPVATELAPATLPVVGEAAIPIVAGGVAVVLSANTEKAFGVIHDSDLCSGTTAPFDAVNDVLAQITATNCNEWKLSQQLSAHTNGDVGPLANFAIGSQSCHNGVCATITAGPLPEKPPFSQYFDYCVSTSTAHGFAEGTAVTTSSPPTDNTNLWYGGPSWQSTPNQYTGCLDTVPSAQSYSVVPAGNIYASEGLPPFTAWEAMRGADLVTGGTPIVMDVVRQYRCVVTYTNGATNSLSSPAGSEGDGKFSAPQCPGVPSGWVPSRTQIFLTSPSARTGDVLAYDEPTTGAYQSWATNYPECQNSSCLLDLRQNGVSCLFQQINCDGWFVESTKSTDYACYYGTHLIALDECNAYSPTFDASNRASGHAYGDPATGAVTEGQTSPTEVDTVTASLLKGTWVTTGEFAPLTAVEKEEAARSIATQCLAQVGIPFNGVQQVGELPVVHLTAADCTKRSIFAPGNDVAEATKHDGEAIQAGQATVLHYESADDKNSGDNPIPSGWYTRVIYDNCGPNYVSGVTNCDEYPYYSTMEGGPGASLKNIDAIDNRKEGRLLRYFYAACGVTTTEPEFIVAPILAADTPDIEAGNSPSVGICVEP